MQRAGLKSLACSSLCLPPATRSASGKLESPCRPEQTWSLPPLDAAGFQAVNILPLPVHSVAGELVPSRTVSGALTPRGWASHCASCKSKWMRRWKGGSGEGERELPGEPREECFRDHGGGPLQLLFKGEVEGNE